MPVKDLFHFGGPLLNQPLKEYITPHKIAVAILIQEFCLLKTKKNQLDDDFDCMNETEDIAPVVLEPQHRRDFCMLILKLIQCPDMEYHELIDLLDSKTYTLIPDHLENFKKELVSLAQKDVGSIMDTILGLGRFIVDPANSVPPVPLVNKSSPVGVFLRRVQLFFDKLAFSRLVGTCKAFQNYINQNNGVKDLPLNVQCGIPGSTPASTSFVPPVSSSSVDMMGEISENMDLCASSTKHSDLLNDSSKNSNSNKRNEILHDTSGDKKVAGMWSRRQAELFIARQVALIQSDDNSAIPPPQLQQKLREVIKANPEHAEAHYLSYLNCLRVKELCGAMDSLHHYFDRITTVSLQEEKKGFRYTALNSAILHAQFGQKKAAMDALKEAIILAHEAKDNLCLQHAQAWLYKLCDENKEILMERSISKCSDLSLNYLTSLGLQSFAQYAGITGGKPALVFEVVMRSDVLNCQFSMPEMFGMSFAHKSALWSLYGKSEMSALCSQLLLHLDTPDGSVTHTADGTCQAICNLAHRLIDFGEYKLASVVLDHAKTMYPNSEWWLIVEQILYYTQALYQGQWQLARNAILQLSTLDRWESLIRLAELFLAKGDNQGVMNAVSDVLDNGPSIYPSLKVRALLLVAKASPCAAASVLTNALSIAIYHYLDYLIALVIMELANLQLQMGLPNQALKLMDQSLLVVLSHGSLYDQASAMLLFAQCKVASVATPGSDAKNEVIDDAIGLLDKAKSSFKKVEAHSKAKETVYLQALLSHEIGCYNERNKYALEFRQLDELYPTK